jgi:hypothetical protein
MYPSSNRIRMQTHLSARDHYPARKCYAHLLRRKGSGGRVTSFSASFLREVSIVWSYFDDDRQAKSLTVAVVWYFTSLLLATVCGRGKCAWPGMQRSRKERVWRQGYCEVNCLTVVPLKFYDCFTITASRRIALHDYSCTIAFRTEWGNRLEKLSLRILIFG